MIDLVCREQAAICLVSSRDPMLLLAALEKAAKNGAEGHLLHSAPLAFIQHDDEQRER